MGGKHWTIQETDQLIEEKLPITLTEVQRVLLKDYVVIGKKKNYGHKLFDC